MKKLSNAQHQLKKSVAYKKERVIKLLKIITVFPLIRAIFIVVMFIYLFYWHFDLVTFTWWSDI